MATDEPPEELEPRLAVIVDALHRKGADDPTCPACGHPALELADETFFMQAITPGGEIAFTGETADGFEVAAMLCGHCGHIRLHHLSKLVRD